MKTIRSLNKKNSYKKNIFIKSIELTNKQACLLCKNIENPKPLNKEIIDRFQKIKESFTKDFDGFYVNMSSLSEPPRGEDGQTDSRNRSD